MLIPLLAVVVTLACMVASARRLWFATHPTAFDPQVLEQQLRGKDALVLFEALAQSEPRAEWERDLALALSADPASRAALVNEHLTELDASLQRWSRVPRVCARISTSFALILATLVLRRGLADPRELTPDIAELVLRGFVSEALGVVLCGLAGAAFCSVAHTQAAAFVRARRRAADSFIERLEGGGLASGECASEADT